MEKLYRIELDLDTYKIQLQFHGKKEPLVIHFDTPSRRFYFALIALIVNEIKNKGKSGFIHIRNKKKTLQLLDKSLAAKHASYNVDAMWNKIRVAWRHRLPDLEVASLFKIENRDLIQSYEKGGKYKYICSDDECDIWANLFQYDESNTWLFKFAIDSASLDLNDISLTLGDLRDNTAWQEFMKRLSSVELMTVDAKEGREKTKPKRWYRAAVTAVAILIIFVAGFIMLNLYFRPVPLISEIALPEKPSIAVLPFVNINDNPEKDYLCDGITEEIINNLSKLKDLRVISRTSSFYFKDKGFDIRTIGEKLNVENIIEGSVRISGNQLRISAQLIKVADDSHLWSETYDRNMEDIFATQENLAQEIACSLKSLLGCEGGEFFGKRYTVNVEAYQLYLKGRYFWNRVSYKKAIEYFEQAVALDPNYALAYAGLADAYNRMGFFFTESVTEYYLKAKAAVMKALEIDDMLSESHASLGYLKLHYEWDWKGAERALKRAIELNPGNALAYRYYSEYLMAVGRLDEALAEMKIALELDPLSRGINAHFGMLLIFDLQLDNATKQLKKTLELYPNHPIAVMHLGSAYVNKGNYEEGIALLEKAVNLTRRNAPIALGYLGYAYGVAGKREKAQEILYEVLERSKRGSFAPNPIAGIYTGLGDKDKAFELLEKAYEERHPSLYPLKTIPKFRSLHSDPRFTALLKKMGLEE